MHDHLLPMKSVPHVAVLHTCIHVPYDMAYAQPQTHAQLLALDTTLQVVMMCQLQHVVIWNLWLGKRRQLAIAFMVLIS